MADDDPVALLWQVISYDALCGAILDHFISAYLARDEFCAGFIERELVERKPAVWKRETLASLIRQGGEDVAAFASLPAELAQLSRFRDAVVHSQADHGNQLRRLRRRKAKNEVWEITAQEIRDQNQRGMTCHSRLFFLVVFLTDEREMSQEALNWQAKGPADPPH